MRCVRSLQPPYPAVPLSELSALQTRGPARCSAGLWGTIWGQPVAGGGCLSPRSGSALLGRKGRGEPGLFPALEWEGCSQLDPGISPFVWS